MEKLTCKVDATQGVYVTDRGDGQGFKAIVSNATDAVKFRKGYMTAITGKGENFVFESLCR